MLLTIDAGNTNISCGVFDGEQLVTKFRFITKQQRTADEFALQFHSIFEVRKIDERDVTDVIISSVVPSINDDLTNAVKSCFAVEPLMITSGVKTGIAINIDDPKSCGADLIVDCVAGYDRYKRDCLIVDFGTATKFLYVSDKGAFQYGIISPGLEITASSLWQMTAQLPMVQLSKPESILAKNTVNSMQAGIVYGYIGLTEGIINQIKKEIGHEFPIIATGGLGRYIYPEVDCFDDYDPDLAYKGMKLIYSKNR